MKTKSVGLIPITTISRIREVLLSTAICAMVLCGMVPAALAAGPEEWPAVYYYTPEGYATPIGNDEEEMAASALACKPSLQISLNESGWARVTPSMMLYALDYPADQYVVTTDTGNDIVTCDNIGQLLMASIEELPTGNTCMSILAVEDKLPPMLLCEDDTIPCNVNIEELDFLSFIDSVYDNCTPFDELGLIYSYNITEFDCDPDSMAGRIDVIYTATDNMGMSRQCEKSIYLKKFGLDDVVFPADTILNCINPDVSPENVGVPTIGGTPIDHFCELIAWSNETQFGLCSGEFKVSRMWSVMDWCTGETITDLQSIYVKDTFPPEIDCPEDVTLGTDPSVCFTKYTLPSPDVTDICSDDDQIEVTFKVSGFFPIYEPGDMLDLPPGDHVVTVRAVDDCMTMGTCQYTITVVDDEAPVLVCHNYSTNLNDLGFSVLNAASAQFFASDNCGIDSIAVRKMVDICGNPQDTVFGPFVTFCCEEAGTSVMVVFQAIDLYGNEQQCMIEVVVKDATPPTALCKDIMAFLDINGAVTITPADIDNGSFDNCEIISYEIDKDSFVCMDLHPSLNPHDVTLTVTDASGLTGSCIGVVTVKDTIPPQAFCNDITVQLDSVGFATIVPFDIDAGSIDNCQIVYLEVQPDSFSCADVGLPIIGRLIVEDQSGNRDTCESNITVIDNPPTVMCKDATLCLDSMGMVTVMQSDIDDFMDDCGIDSVIITPPVLTCEDLGVNTVTLTIVDVFGASASCEAEVTVEDKIAPRCETMDITVYLDENGQAAIDSNAVDNGSSDECGLLEITVDPNTFGCGDVGENVVIQTVTDIAGNTSTCTATVEVLDTFPPECSTTDITVYLDDAGQVMIANDAVNAGEDDPCGIDSITVNPNSFGCDMVGANVVVQTVTDVNGNRSTCTATVTVLDTIAPECQTIDIEVYLDEMGNVSINNNSVDDGSSDNCAVMDITVTPTDFMCDDVGMVTVTQTVTDVNGNSSTCDATVTVFDTIAPECLTMDITLMLDENGEATIANDAVDAGSNDACGIASIELDQLMFDCSDGDAVVVTQTVTDVNGNMSTCTATVTIQNTGGPMAVCEDITVYLDGSGMVSIMAEDVNGGSSVNCGELMIEIDIMDFDCDDIGDNDVELKVTDESGLMDSCIAIVTVLDTIPPVVTTMDVTVYLDDAGMASVGIPDIDAGSSDNCDVDLTLTPTDFECEDIGDNNVVLTGVDPSGNMTSTDATVTVLDTIAPVCVSVDSIFITLPGNGMASIDVGQVDDGSSDNCAIETLSIDITDFDCDDIGDNTVTLTVTDSSGNTSTCTTVVVIEDGMNFECNTNDITVFLDENGMVVIVPGDIDNGSGGGCNSGTPMLSLDQTMFDCDDIGTVEVTLTVTTMTDTIMCPANVTIVDITPPEITCPADMTVDCGTNLGDLSQFGDAMATDNCEVDDIDEVQSFDLDDCGQGTVTRTFTATDASGNTSACTQIITVGSEPFMESDIIWPAPVVNLPECSSTDPEDIAGGSPILNIPDGSCAMVSVSNSDSVVTTCDTLPSTPCVVVFRTWSVFDSCDPGNMVFTYDQVINVQDSVGPQFSPIADITVSANAPADTCAADVQLIATATACGMNVSNITNDFNDGGADASGVYPFGTTTVTFTAEDECCNVSTLSVDVTVVDPGTPTFTCFKPIVCIPPSGILEFTAADFIMFENDEGCSQVTDYFISFSSTDPFDQDTMFNCGNAGEVPLLMIWIWNADQVKIDSCFGDLDINDGPPDCPETNCGTENLTVSGSIFNEKGMQISHIPVMVSEPGMPPSETNDQGEYEVTGLVQGGNYAIGPHDNTNVLKGVTTLDLVAMQKHLLNLKRLESPYQLIAADVNGNGEISAIDILELRKTLLGLQDGFPGNTSWRFVDSHFNFPDPFNPFMTSFPEEMIVGDLQESMTGVDFVGVKVGDVNLTYTNLNSSDEEDVRKPVEVAITLHEQRFKGGEVVRIPVKAVNFSSVAGYQFALGFDELAVEFIGIDIPSTSVVDKSNFGLKDADKGLILTSWSVGSGVTRSADEVLFELEFKAKRDGAVSELFTLESDKLRAEAYVDNGLVETTSLDIFIEEEGTTITDEEFALWQNRPNPFSDRSEIPVFIPEEGNVEVLIHAIDGHLVYSREYALPRGFHKIQVDHTDLGASGIYYYTVQTDNYRATRKLTLLD